MGLYLLAGLFIGAGINHFRIPRFYEKMIPPYWRFPRQLNIISGCLEIVFGGLLLIPAYRSLAAGALIVLLVLFFTVHIYMLQERNGKFSHVPTWLLWLRLPLQLPLIFWAKQYLTI